MTNLINKIKSIFSTKQVEAELHDKLEAIVCANKAEVKYSKDEHEHTFTKGAIKLYYKAPEHAGEECTATVNGVGIPVNTCFLSEAYLANRAEIRLNELNQVLAVLNATK